MLPEYDEEKKVKSLLIVISNVCLIILLIFICVSCTINLVMTHSQGAGDVVDADPKTDAEAEADLKMIPLLV